MVSSNTLTEIILSSAIILVNVAEIILIFRERKTLSLFQLLLLSVAVADLLVGASQLSISILALHGIKEKRFKLNSVLYFTIAVSVNHVNAITVDRLLAVRWPLKHRYMVSRRRILLFAAIMWCISVLSLLPLFVSDSMDYVRYVLSIVMFAYTGVMVFVYSYIIYRAVVVRRRAPITATQGSQDAAQASRDMQLVIVSVILTVTFMACTMPFCVAAFINESVPKPIKYLLISNSFCNPFIYFFWKLLQAILVKRKKGNSAAPQLPMTKST